MALSFLRFFNLPHFRGPQNFRQIKYLLEGLRVIKWLEGLYNSYNIDSRLREIGPIVGLVLAGTWLFANHVRR